MVTSLFSVLLLRYNNFTPSFFFFNKAAFWDHLESALVKWPIFPGSCGQIWFLKFLYMVGVLQHPTGERCYFDMWCKFFQFHWLGSNFEWYISEEISFQTIRSWHIVGRLGGCNSMNMQVKVPNLSAFISIGP